MKNPVMIETGHSFEKEEIERWFKKHDTNPKTNLPVKSKKLIPNISLKNAIETF